MPLASRHSKPAQASTFLREGCKLTNFYLEAREKVKEATEALEMEMTYESTLEGLEALDPEKADEDELRREDFTEEMVDEEEEYYRRLKEEEDTQN